MKRFSYTKQQQFPSGVVPPTPYNLISFSCCLFVGGYTLHVAPGLCISLVFFSAKATREQEAGEAAAEESDKVFLW